MVCVVPCRVVSGFPRVDYAVSCRVEKSFVSLVRVVSCRVLIQVVSCRVVIHVAWAAAAPRGRRRSPGPLPPQGRRRHRHSAGPPSPKTPRVSTTAQEVPKMAPTRAQDGTNLVYIKRPF